MARPALFGKPGCRCHCCILRNARCSIPAALLTQFVANHWTKCELLALYRAVDHAMLEPRP